jgi:hypothetical protein
LSLLCTPLLRGCVGVSAVGSNKLLASIIGDRGTEGGKDTGVDKWIWLTTLGRSVRLDIVKVGAKYVLEQALSIAVTI